MGDWLERTKSRHFGAFGDSYPKVSPFSAKKQTVKELVSMQSFSNSNNKNEWVFYVIPDAFNQVMKKTVQNHQTFVFFPHLNLNDWKIYVWFCQSVFSK